MSFLSPKIGTNDQYTMVKENICLKFGSRFCLNQVKFPLSDLLNLLKTLLQKNAVLSNSPSIFCLKIWKKIIRQNLIKKANILTLEGPGTS